MPDPTPSAPWRQKIGYYALGVAVGCCLLGVIWANRARIQRERDAARRAAEAAVTAPVSAPAPAPPTR